VVTVVIAHQPIQFKPQEEIAYTIFNPQTGQSVMWYNPSVAPKPHTVTLGLDNNTRP
jgi:hypothetical protein